MVKTTLDCIACYPDESVLFTGSTSACLDDPVYGRILSYAMGLVVGHEAFDDAVWIAPSTW